MRKLQARTFCGTRTYYKLGVSVNSVQLLFVVYLTHSCVMNL